MADTDTHSVPPAEDRPVLSVTAWGLLLVGSQVPNAVAREVFGVPPPRWLVPVQLVLIAGVLGLTTVERFRPLRPFVLALFVVQAVKYLQLEVLGPGIGVELRAQMTFILVQWLFVLGLLAVLVATGASRERLYLRAGDLWATSEREWVPGLRRGRPWWLLGVVGGGVASVVTVGYILSLDFLTYDFGTLDAGGLAVLVPVVLFLAVSNALYEEFVYRAAPLADLVDALGKARALLLLAAFFAMSHYRGVPGGVPGVGMTFVLGWFASKMIHETRGLALAIGIHAVLDTIIFSATLT